MKEFSGDARHDAMSQDEIDMRQDFKHVYDDISDAIEFAHRVQRDAVLEVANTIDPRLHDEFVTMLAEDPYSAVDLIEIIKTIDSKAADKVAVATDGYLQDASDEKNS